jgi:hypothetical protein
LSNAFFQHVLQRRSQSAIAQVIVQLSSWGSFQLQFTAVRTANFRLLRSRLRQKSMTCNQNSDSNGSRLPNFFVRKKHFSQYDLVFAKGGTRGKPEKDLATPLRKKLRSYPSSFQVIFRSWRSAIDDLNWSASMLLGN